MNEQKPPNSIEWTRILKPDGTYTKGFTWNVLAGCMHGCKWVMPDGKEAQCYAKTVAERVAQAAYPMGFEHHYFHPERLTEPFKVKEPAGIFLDSMADLMGHWVTDEQINQVLDACRKAHWHTFFLLTKNAPRLSKFEFPANVWVGASSPPDYMFGNRLTRDQQEKMMHRTLKVLQEVKAKVRWISFEPLSWDCSEIVNQYPGALTWAVIGAASNGPTEYPPAVDDLVNMLKVLDAQKVPIFYKGNMRTLPMTGSDWRHNFPEWQVPDDHKPKFRGYTDYIAPDYQWGNSAVFETELPVEPEPTPEPEWKEVKVELIPIHPDFARLSPEVKKTTLANVKDDGLLAKLRLNINPDLVYIGRTNGTYGLVGSKWANPFTIDKDTPEHRAQAVARYRGYITERITKGELNIEELRGKTLCCYCAPKECHGDVLLELLGEKQPAQTQHEEVVQQPSLFDLAPVTIKKHFD
jgi:protein gp37